MATKKAAKASARAKTKPVQSVQKSKTPAKAKLRVAAKATAKPVAKSSAKAKPKARAVRAPRPGLFDGIKPCKRTFTDTELLVRGMERASIERKQVKAVHDDLAKIFAASAMKGGVNKFKMLGMGFTVVHVPPKKMPAVKKGAKVKGFGGVEVISPGKAAYTKPGRFRVRVRVLKKLRDAILGT